MPDPFFKLIRGNLLFCCCFCSCYFVVVFKLMSGDLVLKAGR